MSAGRGAVPDPPVLPLTPREELFAERLGCAAGDPRLHRAARAAATRALGAWAEGHARATSLFAGPIDADGRLALLRWSLLEELARIGGADALPLPGLLSLGDPTPEGWMKAVEVALRGVRLHPPRGRQRVGGPVVHHCGPERAATTLGVSEHTRAPSLTGVETGVDVKLALGGTADARTASLGWHESDRGSVCRTFEAAPESWRALHALVGGLHAVDRMALPPERAKVARGALARGIADVLRGTEPAARKVVDDTVAALSASAPRSGKHLRPPCSADWASPAAFAAIAAALDRLGGRGGLRAPTLEPGTWVEVLRNNGRRSRGTGWILDAEEARRLRRRRPWGRSGHLPPETVPVLIDGKVRDVAIGTVLSGPRISLFE